MRKYSPNAFLIVLAAGAACATVPVPQGKGFESLDAPFADSFVVSGTVRQSYASQNLTGAMAKYAFAMMFPSGSYQLDTVAKVVTASPTGSLVTADSAGLQHQYRMVVTALGVTRRLEYSRHYDVQGRLVVEHGSTVVESDVPVVPSSTDADTTWWTWTNPGCADDRIADTLRAWNVDDQGRCSIADVRVLAPTGSGSVSTGIVDKFIWEGAAISKAFRLQGADTLLRDVFAVDPRGNVIEQVSHQKVGGAWILTEIDTFQYDGLGNLQQAKLSQYAGGDLVSRLLIASTNSRTGVLDAARSQGRWLAVGRDGNSVSFTNGLSESVTLDLVDARGRRLGAMLLQAGSTVAWNAPPQGPVFWRAQAGTRSISGLVLPAR